MRMFFNHSLTHWKDDWIILEEFASMIQMYRQLRHVFTSLSCQINTFTWVSCFYHRRLEPELIKTCVYSIHSHRREKPDASGGKWVFWQSEKGIYICRYPVVSVADLTISWRNVIPCQASLIFSFLFNFVSCVSTYRLLLFLPGCYTHCL